MKEVWLKSGKERSVLNFHPWVFSGAVKKMDDDIQEGELVRLCGNHGEPLAVGLFNNGSIQVRILEFGVSELSKDFFLEQFQNAWTLRRNLGIPSSETNGFRLIHGEGDNLPGLIVDVFNTSIVMQFHNIGMYKFRERIVSALEQSAPFEIDSIYQKSEDTLPKVFEIKNSYLKGEKEFEIFKESGISYKADWQGGQKTGFFLDQRENRRLLRKFAHGKKVLNTFSYSGGFSIPCLQAGAELVDSVDISKAAVDLASSNAALNGEFPNHNCITSDAFKFLEEIPEKKYDIIILDPPAFAKSRKVVKNAARGYQRLNTLGFEKVKTGGIIFTFSCSQAIDKDLFRKIVFSAAQEVGRDIRILYQLGQPADHPINIYHPEGEYLKGFVLQVL